MPSPRPQGASEAYVLLIPSGDLDFLEAPLTRGSRLTIGQLIHVDEVADGPGLRNLHVFPEIRRGLVVIWLTQPADPLPTMTAIERREWLTARAQFRTSAYLKALTRVIDWTDRDGNPVDYGQTERTAAADAILTLGRLVDTPTPVPAPAVPRMWSG